MVLIDKFPVGLNFEDESDKIQLTNPVSLDESWTVETWLSLSNSARQNQSQNLSEQKLVASDPQQDARFGNSVAVSGNNAIVGAYQESSKAGSAYIFEFDSSGTWLEKQKLIASDGSAGDLFGRSVAISGNFAIVGADDEDTGGRSAGSAYIFERDDNGTWTEKAKIQASNKGASDNFGYAVAISNNFAIVGAYGEDTKGSNAGSAYIFERNDSGSWSETQKLLASDGSANDNFGSSLAISDNFAIVGAWKEDTGGSNAGSAYIFERDGSGTWSETKKLLASDGSADARFGRSVAISDNFAIVGADNEATVGKSTGSAYIFERDSSSSWSETQKLLASDKQEWDNFGYSVSISGNLAIVGAYGKDTEANNAGAAYLFERDGSGTWTESKKLIASDGSAEDNFGRSVALSNNFAMIGALGKETGGSGAGSAYIFVVQDQPIPELANRIFEQKIKTSDPKGNDNFGTSVAVSGNIAIVGATTPPRMYHPVAGSAYIIEPESNQTEAKIQQLQASDAKILDNFGASVAISGSIALVGAPGANTAYIFEHESNGTWLEKQKLQGSDIKARVSFGCSVAISGNIALVGALSEDTGASNAGAAYIFERDDNGTWTERAKIQASDKQASDQFGWSVAISRNIALVGALCEDTGGSNAGSAYIFERDTSGTWTEIQKLQASDREVNDFFGVSVAINGDFAIVGAPKEDTGAINAGAAYIFKCDSNGTWSQSQKILARDPEPNDLFGHSVAINDNLAIVGARKKDTGGSDAGAAYIFECNSNGIWSEGKKILASDAKSGDEFGHSVAINDNFAIVGSPKEDTGGSSAGAAYIFPQEDVPNTQSISSSTSESEPEKILVEEKTKLVASDAQNGDYFGNSVAVSDNFAIVGTGYEDTGGNNAGAAYIFGLDSSGSWIEQQKLVASDAGEHDTFGDSVAITNNFAIVGAVGKDTRGNNAGAAYIFELDSSGTWIEKQTLQAKDTQQFDYFGRSVAISGNFAIVGAFGKNTVGAMAGAAYIFERDSSGTWTEKQRLVASDAKKYANFGNSVAITNNLAIVGAINAEDTVGAMAGAAYIFERDSSGTWTEKQKLVASDAQKNDKFSHSVAITNDLAIVGAINENTGGKEAGAAYLFERDSSGTWTEIGKLVASDAQGYERFGNSVAISDQVALVGAVIANTEVKNTGAVYVFERDINDIWTETQKIQASDGNQGDSFGNSLAVSDSLVIVAAFREDTGGSDAGAAYIFAMKSESNSQPVRNRNILVGNSNSDSPVVIQDQSKLGTVVDGVFYDSGYNLEQLTPGWHHLTAVAQDTTTKFYIDGQKIADVKQALLDAADDDASRQQLEAKICKTTADISTIGASTSDPQDLAKLKLAEVRVWNQALSESQITVNSNKVRLTGNEAGLTAYYPLNEATGTEVVDRSNANNGTVTGAGWWCGTVPIDNLNNSVMQFDGVDDYIDLGDGVVVGDHFTEEAWIYSTSTDNRYHGFLGQHASKRAPSIWLCEQNKIHGDFNGGGRLQTKSSEVMFADAWNHVAVTYDGVDYKIYVNGEECFSKNLDHEPASTTPIKYIGKVDNHFQGQIAEVRIWNKTRTREEIQADMYQRLTGDESDLVAYLPLNEIQTEGGTQKVSDLTSNNNHGTVHGATLESSNTLPIS